VFSEQGVQTIDYECEDRKSWLEKLRGEIGADRPWLILISENSDHQPPKHEPFSQDMLLKISSKAEIS
jgi:hypothetical protein